MAADFTIKQGDTLPSIVGVLSVGNAVLPDLASASTVQLVMARRQAPDVYVFAKNAVITDDVEGIVQYNWVAGDTDEAGEYLASWLITYLNGSKRTIPTVGHFTVTIEESLPTVAPVP